MKKIKSVNPSNRDIIGEIEESSEKDINLAIKKARKSNGIWKELKAEGRVKLLRNVVVSLAKRKAELAKMASMEMGMPITASLADLDDSVNFFNWYLDNASEYLCPEIVYEDEKMKHTVYREPIGISANITPWNFPISNFVWSAAQTLIAGNTVVYKTSEEVPLSGKLIEEIVSEANLPDGVFSEVYGDGEVGKILVNGDIDLICFTGSTIVGKYLYNLASEKFIKANLELGGSAPGIVFADSNIDRIIDSLFWGRFFNNGQVCDGLKRLIVSKKVVDDLIQKISEKIRTSKIGDALDEKTEIGPLVSERQLHTLEQQINSSVKSGAKVVIGGKRISNLNGFFYQPTLLTNISTNMRVWNEEVFGPVLPIMTFDTEEEALELANETKYGLGAYIFTEDKDKAKKLAQSLETGMVSINNASYIKPSSPFGGYKESGIGREHGKYGFHELTQVKVVAEEK